MPKTTRTIPDAVRTTILATPDVFERLYDAFRIADDAERGRIIGDIFSERSAFLMPHEQVPGLNALAAAVHEANAKWWISVEDGVTPLKRNKGELLMLIVSEIAEAMEGERKDLMDDKLPHRKMAEVELADALIRILDYSAGFGYDIEGAFVEKMAYNRTREDHSHEARKIAGGKQF